MDVLSFKYNDGMTTGQNRVFFQKPGLAEGKDYTCEGCRETKSKN
jgi:hypothetical protein